MLFRSIDSSNTIWVVSRHNINFLYKYNKLLNSFQQFNTYYEKDAEKNGFLCILQESARYIWLGTWNKGLQKLDIQTGAISQVLPNQSPYFLSHIHSLTYYSDDILLIGSDDGLSFYNKENGDYKLITPDETQPYSISDKFIYPITKDKEGGIWIGTYYGGVNYLAPNNGQFSAYNYSKYKNSVGGKIISRFCEDNNGNIWIGSDDGGLSLFNPKTGKFCNYTVSKNYNSLSYANVHSLCMDGDNLWIGTYTGGLNILNTKTGKFKIYNSITDDETTLDGSSIYAIFKDKDNDMWATSMSGVNKYDRTKDNFIRVKDFGFMTIDIDQDLSGNIWFATQGKGLFKYNEHGNSWTNYSVENEKNFIFNNMVNDIHIIKNEIWVATSKGLAIYNKEKDCFERFLLETDVDNILGITSESNTLWLTTTSGLIHLNPKTKKMQIYTKSDGLQSNQFLPASILKTSDNKIYIGSVDGFNVFYPQNININNHIPPIVITDFIVMNKNIHFNENEAELSSKENVFSFHFASLSYCTPVKNQFMYKLEGFDNDWIMCGDTKIATYTNLPAGNYIFKVKGTNSDGIWNEQGATFKLTILPPFYMLPIFKLLYFLISLIIIVLILKFFINKTRREHNDNIIKLKKENEETIQKSRIQFFTMIAHEIRTPVSLIIGPMENIMNDLGSIPESFKDDLEIINRNSKRLLTLINQILDFRKVEQGEFSINKRYQNLSTLIEHVIVRFAPSAKQKGVNIDFNSNNNNLLVNVDPEAITKVISNLLSNALKFTKDNINVNLEYVENEKIIKIVVSDNGCGISKEQQKKIFNPFYQTDSGIKENGTGIGLHIVKTLVKAHEGKISLISNLDKGSSFIISIPFEKKNISQDLINSLNSSDYNEMLNDEPVVEDIVKQTDSTQKKILIVEDDPDMLSFLVSSLKNDFIILTADNGITALEVLADNSVSLIISDWMMKSMDGITLCKSVRSESKTSHIPFIILTARTDDGSKVKSMKSGADMHIEKPFSVQHLKACINNILDIRSQLHHKLFTTPLTPIDSIAENGSDVKFLSDLNNIIEENFSYNDLSIDFIASKMKISRSGLFSKIKTITDSTPNELIMLIRMKKAAQLLLENKYRINEICYMVGFNNPSYFSKCFLKQFGVKPLDFVNNHKKIAEEEIVFPTASSDAPC